MPKAVRRERAIRNFSTLARKVAVAAEILVRHPRYRRYMQPSYATAVRLARDLGREIDLIHAHRQWSQTGENRNAIAHESDPFVDDAFTPSIPFGDQDGLPTTLPGE